MVAPSHWPWSCLLALAAAALAPLHAADPATAQQLWQLGQGAMRAGRPAEAIRYYHQSLAADPGFVRNHLSLAAAYLEAGDDARACPHLGAFVEANPDQLSIRLHYADLLLRLQRLAQAQDQFQRCVADAQRQPNFSAEQLIQCHGQLVDIAERLADGYAEHLHRGIGLYLLARQRAGVGEGELSEEALLCRAAGELTLARVDRPEEARPGWYLWLVWSRLGQRQPALRCLRHADDRAAFSYLTPAEQRDLQAACSQVEAETFRRW